ncbi:MAG: hypothetical protein V4548_10040 [Bacteroidota bacterium]
MKYLTIKSLVIALFALFISPQLFAHTLWIETKATGAKGKPQEINVFFGEFGDKDISPTAKWFSDLKNFTLFAISPSKKEIKLTSTALENSYQTFFTPTEDGIYTIVMRHIPKDIYGTTKLDYNSSATVTIGNKTEVNEATINSNIVSLFSEMATTAKQNSAVKILALNNLNIAPNQEIKVFAPNGWGKQLYSNEKGEINFIPLWPGNYMVEFALTDKTAGELNGKKYDDIWKVATYVITVK